MSGDVRRVLVNVSVAVTVELTPAEAVGEYDPAPESVAVDAVWKAIRAERSVEQFLGDWGLASWDDADVSVVLLGEGDRTVGMADVRELMRRSS